MNKKNANGEPHGLWIDYHETGELWRKYNYKDGLLHGLYESYEPDGELRYLGIFKDNDRIGFWFVDNFKKYFYL